MGQGIRQSDTANCLSPATALDANADYTLMGWFRFASFEGVYSTPLVLVNDDDTRLDTSYQYAGLRDVEVLAGEDYAYDGDTGSPPLDTWIHVALVRDGADLSIWIDGMETFTATLDVSEADPVTMLLIGGWYYGGYSVLGDIAACRAWTAALDGTEITAEMASAAAVRSSALWADWRMTGADETARLQDSSGNGRHLTRSGDATGTFDDGPFATGITATLAATLDALTADAAGTAEAAGTLAATLGAALLDATATAAVAGTLSATLDAATATGAGTAALAGAISATLDAATATAGGTASAAGALSATLDDATGAASGATAATGSAAATLDDATATATGAVALGATGAATLDALTLGALGALGISAALAATLEDAALAATGTAEFAPITGVLLATLDDALCAATGAVAVAGAGALVLDAATGAASGAVAVACAAAVVLDDATLSGVGVVLVLALVHGTVMGARGTATANGPGARGTVSSPAERG